MLDLSVVTKSREEVPLPSLQGKIAWVTGSSRGIGGAVALELAQAGADVAVHYRTSQTEAEELCEKIDQLDHKSFLVQGEIRSPDEVNRMADEIEEKLGSVDILVNNAAYALCKPFLDYTIEEWLNQLNYKGLAYFLTAHRLLPNMLEKGEGVIINILSTVGLRNGAGELAYAASNGAAIALTRGLASEFSQQGVRVCGVVLTWAENAFDPENPEHREWLPKFAMHRVTKLEEVAQTVAFLASPAASGITGSLIPVDAGFLCR